MKKMELISMLYEWTLMDELVGLEDNYPEEIELFIKNFNTFIKIGMHDLIGSMEVAQSAAKNHQDP